MVPTSPQPDAAAPDWAAQQDDILCPLCDYNLRGLSEPRCPECGYRFTWPELMDEARRRHPYLFEQRLRRPIWSFFRTVRGGLMPASFWKSIHPALPVRPYRLWLYWGLVLLPLLLSMSVVTVGVVANFLAMPNSLVPVDWTLIPPDLLTYYLWPMLVWCCWPAVLFMTLMIFRLSMRRARVKTAHVFRCITYSCDSLLILNIVTLGISVSEYFYSVPRGWRYTSMADDWVCYAMALWMLLTTWHLRQAYRHYLRFDHPLATVLVSQFIVFLAVLVVVIQLGFLH